MKTLEEHLQFADDCFTFSMRFVWDQQRRHPEKSRKELMGLIICSVRFRLNRRIKIRWSLNWQSWLIKLKK